MRKPKNQLFALEQKLNHGSTQATSSGQAKSSSPKKNASVKSATYDQNQPIALKGKGRLAKPGATVEAMSFDNNEPIELHYNRETEGYEVSSSTYAAAHSVESDLGLDSEAFQVESFEVEPESTPTAPLQPEVVPEQSQPIPTKSADSPSQSFSAATPVEPKPTSSPEVATADDFLEDLKAIVQGEKTYDGNKLQSTAKPHQQTVDVSHQAAQLSVPEPAAPPQPPNPAPVEPKKQTSSQELFDQLEQRLREEEASQSSTSNNSPTVNSTYSDAHSVFDRMGKNVAFANSFDLGTITLEQRFDEFDRMLDAEEYPNSSKPFAGALSNGDEKQTSAVDDAIKKAQAYMIDHRNKGWSGITKDLLSKKKKGEPIGNWLGIWEDWEKEETERDRQITNNLLNAIHARREQIIQDSITAVKGKVKEQVEKIRKELRKSYQDEKLITSSIQELDGGGLGSADATSDVDVTLTGDGTDIAVEMLNQKWEETPESQKGDVSFAYLYDVNYYPAAFVPERDVILAPKQFPKKKSWSNLYKWLEEDISDNDIRQRIDESQEITAWLHVKLDVKDEQWKAVKDRFKKFLINKTIRCKENEFKLGQDEKLNAQAQSIAYVVERKAKEKEDNLDKKEEDGENERLKRETDSFGEVAKDTFKARELYLSAKEREKIYNERDKDFYRKQTENAYANLMQKMETASVYANEAMFTRGSIAIVVANMQVLGYWDNPETEGLKFLENYKKPRTKDEKEDEKEKNQAILKAALKSELQDFSKLNLQRSDAKNSVIEHYGRILHVLNGFKENDRPVEVIHKAGKYINRFYRSVYECKFKENLVTDYELFLAQQLEGVKKGKIGNLKEFARENSLVKRAQWENATTLKELENKKIEVLTNLFQVSTSKLNDMEHVKREIEKIIAKLLESVLDEAANS